ncbi:MAG: NADH-quinone oxidoreductase subunit N [Candidatus Marsarchaeota archaeon]|nr:NADH-quinone oxidoreductase subunit N [Candidatus Marsarchaeota archaeon]
MMYAMYAFFALLAALVLGNIALLAAYKKEWQFALNGIVLLLLVILVSYLYASGQDSVYLGLVSVNSFSMFFMLLFAIGMILANALYYEFAEDYCELAMLGALMLVGMYLVSGATTLVTLFLGLELVSMPMVFSVLLARRSLESAVKLFIMASVSIALFSFAMALALGGAGTLDLGQSAHTYLMVFVAIIFIASMGFETSIFPFNVLIPDVYEGAPAYLTGTMGGMSKTAGFAALLQILILVFITYRSAFLVVAVLSVFTMLYGNIAALAQKNLKRLLAYSSISQAGYILIGIATYAPDGIAGALFQVFAHAIIFIGMFAIVAWLETRNKHTIDDIAGLARENRLAAFALTLFMLSLIGLPFTTGFIGKLLIFLSAVNNGLLWLALLGIINSIISIYYYAKPIISMYALEERKRKARMPVRAAMVVVFCLLLTVAVGVYPQPVITLVGAAAAHLFA